MKTYYTIYQTTNLLNGKIYIGKHQTKNPNDNYIGSGVALKKAIKKYGSKNFKKEVLFIFNTAHEMNVKEKEIVNEAFIKNEMTYNLGIGGEGGSHFKDKKHSIETKKVLSEKIKGKKLSLEARQKISNSNSNRTLSEETRKKLSEKAKERFSNKEQRDKISNTLKKRNMNEDIKLKMSESAKLRELTKKK